MQAGLLPLGRVAPGLPLGTAFAGVPALYVLLCEGPGCRLQVTQAGLLRLCLADRARHVVITGHGLARYELAELTRGLLRSGRTVQVETDGVGVLRVASGTWVTLTPGGVEVEEEAVQQADEIRMPVALPCDLERLEEILEDGPKAEVWLRPLGRSPAATALCVEAATLRGYRVATDRSV
jgi:hypothetical protein